jgi:hypothetical protein
MGCRTLGWIYLLKRFHAPLVQNHCAITSIYIFYKFLPSFTYSNTLRMDMELVVFH